MHKNSPNLLMDTLEAGNTAIVLPISTKRSWDDGHRAMPDSISVLEMRAEKTVAEMDVAFVPW